VIYRAKLIIPVSSEPIYDGEIFIKDGRIASVSSSRTDASEDSVVDLGDCAILPAFVNVHTHLGYTILEGRLAETDFAGWITSIAGFARKFNDEDFKNSAALGALKMLRGGIVNIADAAYCGEELTAASNAGLRGIGCVEVFGEGDSPDFRSEVINSVCRLQEECGDRIRVGLSPHSVYTCGERRLRLVSKISQELDIPLIVHAAESFEEVLFVRDGSGPLAKVAAYAGVHPKPRGGTPVEYLNMCGVLSDKTIAAHCVHIDESDINTMALSGVSAAHCPRSNERLKVGVSPYPAILDAGIRVGLGTDSSASCGRLDMFEEMRAAIRLHSPKIDALSALRAATLDGASVFRMEHEIGSIEPGKLADIVVVKIPEPATDDSRDPVSSIVNECTADNVVMTMAGGETLYRDGLFTRIDAERIIAKAKESAARIFAAY